METDGRSRVVMTRLTSLREHDRSFDIEFWQKHTTAERWEAARELVEDYLLRRGLSGDALRLRSTVARLKRRRR